MKLKKTATNTLAHDTLSTNLKTYNKILKTSIRAAKGNFTTLDLHYANMILRRHGQLSMILSNEITRKKYLNVSY